MKRFLMMSVMAVVSVRAGAQMPPRASSMTTFEVSPAAQTDPALKYAMFPRVYEQIPGNAAPLYLNAMLDLPETVKVDGRDKSYSDLLDDYQDMPLKALHDSDAARRINRGMIDLLEQASLRDRAGWETSIRQQGFATLLPYLSRMRMAARVVAVESRIHLADGDIDAALRTGRIIFAISRHMKEDQLLVQTLVGVGTTEVGLEKVIEPVMKTPGAPNLYWALANLPRPYYSMNECIEWEQAGMLWSVPTLRGRRPEELSGEEWAIALREFAALVTNTSQSNAGAQMELTAMAIVSYPPAKAELIRHGYPAEKVNAMPAPQVLGLATLGTYNRWLDETGKWSAFPYWQAAEQIRQADARMKQAKMEGPWNFAYAVMPSMSKAYAVVARLDRHIAALQTVEAIRAYAAAHAGNVPPSLDQITETPAPIDPTTGKLFDYKSTGERSCEIGSPASVEQQGSLPALHYSLTLRSK